MRILIRKREGKQYLQPTSQWSPNRTAAKDFESSVFAYWLAQEQALLDIDILMAFDNPKYDFVPLTR
jgi:hypothetical protein